jgi:hypothetical protein
MTASQASTCSRQFHNKLPTLKNSRWQTWGFNTMAITRKDSPPCGLPPYPLYIGLLLRNLKRALDNIVDAQKADFVE